MVKTIIVAFHIWIWILLVSTAEHETSNEPGDLQLSTAYNTWWNTQENCHMARLKYFNPKLLSWLQNKLPEEESIWTGARAKPTKYFKIYGCAKLMKTLGIDQIKHFQANSAAKCMTHCSGKDFTSFGLMGDICVCINNFKVLALDTKTFCTTSCRGNLNDWCGYEETVMTLYVITNDKTDEYPDLNPVIDQQCVVVSSNVSGPKQSRTCSDSYGFKCYNSAVNQTQVRWSEAVEFCRIEYKSQLYAPDLSYSTLEGDFWAPVIRSSYISWDKAIGKLANQTPNTSEFPWCISIRKMKDMTLSLHEENCEENFRHLVFCDPDDGEFPSTTVAIVSVIAVSLLCVPVLAFCIYKKWQNRMRPRTKSFNNDAYDNEIPSKLNIVASKPRDAKLAQTSPESERVSSAYASINAVDSYSEVADINSRTNMKQGAGKHYQRKNNKIACKNKTTDEGTNMEITDDWVNEHVYDHTNTKVKEDQRGANVYNHTCTAFKDGPRNENVYDKTNTTTNRNNANVYDHTSRITKNNSNNENVYDHSGTQYKKGQHDLNIYDRSELPRTEENKPDDNVYDQSY